ncbi:MAG: hypothetical protein KI790_20350 [Cyclobacteriaceae bacterium]|nr:hypothetical protein [Cyclobacteriaceae bacterium HetDA_MAG_MS6]
MDEITLINLLNKICEKNRRLSWKLNCKYHNGIDAAIMEIGLYEPKAKKKTGFITFRMETGQIIRGKHQGMSPFGRSANLVDALLEILYYESSRALFLRH